MTDVLTSGWPAISAGMVQMVGGLSPVIVWLGGFALMGAVLTFVVSMMSGRGKDAGSASGGGISVASRVGGVNMSKLTGVTHASHSRGRVSKTALASVKVKTARSGGLDTVWAASEVARAAPVGGSTLDYGSFDEPDVRQSGESRA